MESLSYVKPEIMWLKEPPVLDERWAQGKIAEDPSILGLGQTSLYRSEFGKNTCKTAHLTLHNDT